MLNKSTLLLLFCLLIGFYLGLLLFINQFYQPLPTVFYPVGNGYARSPLHAIEPELEVVEVLTGLSQPWDLGFIDNSTFVYTLRRGEVWGYSLVNSTSWQIAALDDVYAVGEGGLLGLLIDKDFVHNRFVYTCMNVSGDKMVVSRWQLAKNNQTLEARQDIVDDLPATRSGRHSGCRMAMSPNYALWITTGDTALGLLPQQPDSLGGKILRVDREGKPVKGNLSAPFDPRVFSYGHRNPQGIALFDVPKEGVFGFTAEHGPDRDDEVNLLKSGNFGWNPLPGNYNETVPMTDLNKFPDAIGAVWSSGVPTTAPSGIQLVKGDKWGKWKDALLVSNLKGSHLRLLQFDPEYKLVRNQIVFEGQGRLRTVVQGPDQNLYLLTANGGGKDKVLQVKPRLSIPKNN